MLFGHSVAELALVLEEGEYDITPRFLTITDKSSRFSETESVAFLTLTVSKYKISIKEEPQFAYETFEQRKTRVLNCTDTITTT